MIRFLQTEGPTKKIILSGLLLIICAAMVITLIPGGLGSDLMGTPGKGVVAKVAGEDITADQVRDEAKQMAQQQAQQYGGANASMLLPFLIQQATPRAADLLSPLWSRCVTRDCRYLPAPLRSRHGAI